MISENKYWVAISDLKIKTEEINKFLVFIYQSKKSNLHDFFEMSSNGFHNNEFDNFEIDKFYSVKEKLNEYQSIQEELNRQNIDVIPINSPLYSRRLKYNLKTKRSPPVIFTKGDKSLLNQDSVAIVGSRSASEISLKFTDDVAKSNVEKSKVIVSGYAKGVDRQALDSALKYNGKSIIVLPQGILTFSSGLTKLKNEIDNGDLLVISTYFPKAPWSVQLAMSRNSIIYGLAEEIIVAESNFSGGTWSGVQEGLKRNQKIYVRKPSLDENNANNKLIELGAISFDWEYKDTYEINKSSFGQVSENGVTDKDKIENLILDYLSSNPKTSKEIKAGLEIEWSVNKIISFLKLNKDVEVLKTRPMKFVRKSSEQMEIFN